MESQPHMQQNNSPQSLTKYYVVLLSLVLILSCILYFWAPYLIKPFNLSAQVGADDVIINIKNFVAPTNGFWVVSVDNNGLPGAVVGISPFLIRDAYPNLNINISKLDNGLVDLDKLYVTFRSDENHNSKYDSVIDAEIPRDIYGSKLRRVIVGGVVK